MSGRAATANSRTQQVARHMSASSEQAPTGAMNQATASKEDVVLFESNKAVRRYILNRPKKLHTLNTEMVELLRPRLAEWNKSELCSTIVGSAVGRGFCAGGDVAAVVQAAANDDTRHYSIEFFHKEFELMYLLASLSKPYVVLMDGFTMGGGAGLSYAAPFRVATEKTVFAMPESKIGYCPDVGGNFYLSRLDGQLGTFLALTGDTISGRTVYELGIATHYIPSARVPTLLERLEALEDPSPAMIDNAIEELHLERAADESNPPLTGAVRLALDSAFQHSSVEKIFDDLKKYTEGEDASVSKWAKDTLNTLELRSPTSLHVALKAIRRGEKQTLKNTIQMELGIATAFCSGASPDFATGVKFVVVDKVKAGRANWRPPTVAETSAQEIDAKFFDASMSPYLANVPTIDISADVTAPSFAQTPAGGADRLPSGTAEKGSTSSLPAEDRDPYEWALPSEAEVQKVVIGERRTDSGSMSITSKELYAKLEERYSRKSGWRQKVEDIVARKCEVVDNDDKNFVWLKWKH